MELGFSALRAAAVGLALRASGQWGLDVGRIEGWGGCFDDESTCYSRIRSPRDPELAF